MSTTVIEKEEVEAAARSLSFFWRGFLASTFG